MSEPTKKTGLGNLLFQRTSQPARKSRPVPVKSEEGTAASPPPEPEFTSSPEPLPPAPASRRQNAKRKRVRIRRTLHLEDDLDARLNTMAGIERRERSEIVNDLLRKHLRKYEITVKK